MADAPDWQLALLQDAQSLASTRGGGPVTLEHVAVVLLQRDSRVRRHWRALGLDDELAVRSLGRRAPGPNGHPGRAHRFHDATGGGAASGQVVVAPEVSEFFTVCRGWGGPPESWDAREVTGTLLTHLPGPVPGSPVRPVERRPGAGPGSAPQPPSGSSGDRPMAGDPDGLDPVDQVGEHGRDLTRLAAMGLLEPLIGRERELDRLVRVLSRKNKRNPLLVGEPGVGKTVLVEGLATLIDHGAASPRLADARLVSISLASLLAGTRYRGEFEARVHELLTQVLSATRHTVLFLDEFHLIVKSGAAEGGMDLSSLVLGAMARDELSLIGATTPAQHEEHIASAGPLARRVQVIEIDEPTAEETLRILRGLRGRYEEFHGVRVEEPALRAAVRLASGLPGRRPDVPLDLLDDACVLAGTSQRADPIVRAGDVETVAAERRSTRPAASGWAGRLRGAASRARS